MQAIKAYFDGHAFIPLRPTTIRKNQHVLMTIVDGSDIAFVQKEHSEKSPIFGSAKGKFHMSDDFDAPLEDFLEYM
jgi:hypothetical protein